MFHGPLIDWLFTMVWFEKVPTDFFFLFSIQQRKVETVSSKEVMENTKIKDRFNLEINNLRKALDEVSRDLAAAIIERDSLRPDRDAWEFFVFLLFPRPKNSLPPRIRQWLIVFVHRRLELENEKKNLQRRLKDAEAALKEARAQLAGLKDLIKEHDHEVHVSFCPDFLSFFPVEFALVKGKCIQGVFQALSAENNSLKQQVDSLKKELSQETNQRVDAENRLQSEREKNALLEGIHSEVQSSMVYPFQRLISASIDWLNYSGLVDTVDWLIDLPVDWVIHWSIDWLIELMVDWLIDLLVDRSIDWLIGIYIIQSEWTYSRVCF